MGKKLYNGRYYPCLQFDYKALQEGTVTVTLHYYYNYALPKTVNGTVWWKEDATFTVTVGEQMKPPENLLSQISQTKSRLSALTVRLMMHRLILMTVL